MHSSVWVILGKDTQDTRKVLVTCQEDLHVCVLEKLLFGCRILQVQQPLELAVLTVTGWLVLELFGCGCGSNSSGTVVAFHLVFFSHTGRFMFPAIAYPTVMRSFAHL